MTHQIIDFIETQRIAQGLKQIDLEARSGVARSTIHYWHNRKNGATLNLVEAVLESLGFRLIVVPLEKK